MTPVKPIAIVSMILLGTLLCIGFGICVSRETPDMDRPVPRIKFSVGEGDTYTNWYKDRPVGPPSSQFQIHPGPALLLEWEVPPQEQELDHAFVSRNNVLIGTLDFEPKRRELIVSADSIELRHGESFVGFQPGQQYSISIGTKNRPLPPDTDDSLKPKNYLRISVK